MTVATAPAAGRALRRARMRRRFLRRPTAVAGLVGVLVAVTIAVFAPLLAPYDPTAQNYDAVLAPPLSPGYPLGTDPVGRDIVSRLIVGARVPLLAGVLATLLGMVAAVPLGLLAGYYRGWLDPIIARATDVVLAFPFLILAIGLAAIVNRGSLLNAVVAIAVGQLPMFLRITRGETLSLREQDYVQAAVVNGAPDRTIMFRHVLPNLLSPLVIQATVTIPIAIIGASILSFLGLGVQPPTPGWGVMLSEAQPHVANAPWFAVFPGLAIAFTTLSFNLFGDGLRDVLDPRTTS